MSIILKSLTFCTCFWLFKFSVTPCEGTLADESLITALPCDSKIFCDGPLLEAAQNAKIFKDSKTFVDLHLKYPPDEVLSAFEEIEDPRDPRVMREFVHAYFDGPNLEFEDWIPTDWKPNPVFLDGIKDDELRTWADDIHSIWKDLGRKVKDDVASNQDRYSLIYLQEPFIVPGGRFRETYYWDTYWEIKGLLISNMTETVKGMIKNFVYLIERYGFVPNGNRVYYTNRSQPPLLVPSVLAYMQATGDVDYVLSILPAMETEYQFWMTNRSVTVPLPGTDTTVVLNQYNVHMGKPRPESFREDAISSTSSSEVETARICSQLASGAESGWDFSSRWLPHGETNLKYVRIKEIVPVDLNSILCMNEWILRDLYKLAGDSDKVHSYQAAYDRRKSAMRDIFWVEDIGVWLDFDLDTMQNRDDEFFAANISPMWAHCYDDYDIERTVFSYLKRKGVLDYPGGVPTSLQESGQQWDYPNAWPPLQEMVIQALDSTQLPEAQEYALRMAQNWTTTNWKAYKKKSIMFEKFDVNTQGVPGHGGEYEVQAGFGWTNGVMLTLLHKYGSMLSSGASAAATSGSPCIIFISTLMLIMMLSK